MTHEESSEWDSSENDESESDFESSESEEQSFDDDRVYGFPNDRDGSARVWGGNCNPLSFRQLFWRVRILGKDNVG